MNFSINWILGLFKKPEVEISFDQKHWPFPVPAEKKTVKVKKATTRKVKPAAKTSAKPVAKKAKKAK